MDIVIVAPSLDPTVNVSGVSAVANFIIQNNPSHHYLHFLQGKGDSESGHLLSRAFRICRTYIKWKRFLHDHPDSIIHYNFPLDAPSIIRDYWFMALAARKRRQLVIHLHGGLYLSKTNRPWLINFFLKRIFDWNVPFIVQSEKEKNILTDEFHAKKVHILANCIDIEDAKAYHKTNFSTSPLEMIYLGRIEPNKGMDDILSAAKTMKENGDDFLLHLAGKEQVENTYIPRFEKVLGQQFTYEGIVSGKAKEDLLKKCHIFLLPSMYEGLPMSLLECMSYGIVPITTNVGSISTVVENGHNGFFVEQKDAKGIVDVIRMINKDREKMRQMSDEARKTIFTHFSPELYISNLNRIYGTSHLSS